MSGARTPVPEGTVSTVRGRWQGPALTWLTRLVLVAALLGLVVPGDVGMGLATAAVAAVVAAPLVRVAWLVYRWVQEGDHRFVATGLGLLLVVAVGAVLAALGIGS